MILESTQLTRVLDNSGKPVEKSVADEFGKEEAHGKLDYTLNSGTRLKLDMGMKECIKECLREF